MLLSLLICLQKLKQRDYEEPCLKNIFNSIFKQIEKKENVMPYVKAVML